MRQRSPGTASQQNCMRGQEAAADGGGLGRGAVPQRLIGSSPCHCVTSSELAIKTAADATKGYAVQCAYIKRSPPQHHHCPLLVNDFFKMILH